MEQTHVVSAYSCCCCRCRWCRWLCGPRGPCGPGQREQKYVWTGNAASPARAMPRLSPTLAAAMENSLRLSAVCGRKHTHTQSVTQLQLNTHTHTHTLALLNITALPWSLFLPSGYIFSFSWHCQKGDNSSGCSYFELLEKILETSSFNIMTQWSCND